MDRKKSVALLLVAALVVSQVTMAFAKESKKAEPVTKPVEYGTEEHPVSANDIANGNFKSAKGSVVHLVTEAKGDSKPIKVVVNFTDVDSNSNVVSEFDVKAFLEAIQQASSLSNADIKAAFKAIKKLTVSQTGAKFKGWFINGKKLTWKRLRDALKSGGELKLTFNTKFKVTKYTMTFYDANGNKGNVYKKVAFATLSGNSSDFAKESESAAKAAPEGKKFIGFASTQGASKADVTEAVIAGKGDTVFGKKKKINLYPVYQ